MKIQVNTDNHVKGGEGLTRFVESVVEGALGRFAERLTRVEVHLSDENSSAKSGDNDMRCVMEARLAGMNPISVTQQDGSLERAIEGAAAKLEEVLNSTIERLQDRRSGA